ncbi:hypothetical protein Lfu02_04890 [Longispora fulva]|uniref:WD40 repeat protein n=1 Tax=Longispora fulva TaxID=619741 RepID=A0A8J7GM91_9ACTN|nr:hypothetical protein [Longispora fulva]MBG6135644.1 WD40 repeat protein [Longispora fulva]GIG56117.1 hypothetical protein Lfu02_04890 [Longispora fulva]
MSTSTRPDDRRIGDRSPDGGTLLFGLEEELLGAATSPVNATRGITGGYERSTLRTFDVATGKARPRPVFTMLDACWSVAYSPDGKRVARSGAGVVGM